MLSSRLFGCVAPVLIAFFVLCDESIAFHVASPLKSLACRGHSVSSILRDRNGGSCLSKTRPPTSTLVRMALDQAVVDKYVAQAAEPSSAKAPTKLAKALKKMSGSIAVAIGYNFDPARAPRPIKNLMTNTLEGSDAKADLRLYSMLMRKENAAALFMDCSTEQGAQNRCRHMLEYEVRTHLNRGLGRVCKALSQAAHRVRPLSHLPWRPQGWRTWRRWRGSRPPPAAASRARSPSYAAAASTPSGAAQTEPLD
jgi:hypothetical protein